MSKSRVIVVINKNVYLSKNSLNSKEIQRSVDTGLTLLTDTPDRVSAWNTMVEPGEVIGIKPNCLGGKNLSSSPLIAQAVIDGLTQAGIKHSDTIIWERSNRELERAGYDLNVSSNKQRCFGTDTNGIGYGDTFHQNGEVASLISRIFESYIDKNINFPLLKDHSIAGISAGMKNYYGLVHNPNKYHPDNCNPFAAQISALPIVKQKHLLTVCDMTRVQYHGGPGYMPKYLIRPGTIMMSFDPVALDSYGFTYIEKLRTQNGKPDLKKSGRYPLWLETAEQLGLGNHKMENIEVIEKDIT